MYCANAASLSKRRKYSGVEEDDLVIYEMLLAGLDQSLQEVDAVFQANGLSQREGSSDEGVCLEMFASRIPSRTYYKRQSKVADNRLLVACSNRYSVFVSRG